MTPHIQTHTESSKTVLLWVKIYVVFVEKEEKLSQNHPQTFLALASYCTLKKKKKKKKKKKRKKDKYNANTSKCQGCHIDK